MGAGLMGAGLGNANSAASVPDITVDIGNQPVLPKRIQVVTLGSAPTIQIVRAARLILSNLSATAETLVWVNLGQFSVPVSIPPTATPVVNYIVELFNGIVPIEITDFSLPQAVPGMTGSIALLLMEY